MNVKDINDVEIKPVIIPKKRSPDTVRGYNMYPEPYSNICLIARKNSGKSTVIYRSLERCAKKGTNIWIFASTVNNDDTYKKMIKMLEKKGCIVEAYDHFIQNGVNILEQIIELLQRSGEEKQKEKVELVNGNEYKGPCFFDGDPDPNKPKRQKKIKEKKEDKIITPEHIFVLDDLSSDMVHPSITKLLTKNRHFKSKMFISCHHVNNLSPSGLRMIDNFLIFGNISKEKIEEVQDKIGLHFKNDTKKDGMLWNIYQKATDGLYNFLYIDKNNFKFRKNFNKQFMIQE